MSWRSRRRSSPSRRGGWFPRGIARHGWNGSRWASSLVAATSSSRARGTASSAPTRASMPRTCEKASSRSSPRIPDASAERLQKDLSARLGLTRLGVVITDTFGRPWREGVVDVAIGCAGLQRCLTSGARRRPRSRAGDHRGRVRRRGRGRERTRDDEDGAGPGGARPRVGAPRPATSPPGPAARWCADRRTTCSGSRCSSRSPPRARSMPFGPGEVARDAVEDAVRAASAAPHPGDGPSSC